MKIFISWSGDRSKAVAKALRKWLKFMIQSLEPWMSSKDIAKGARWETDVAGQLEQAGAGIICLTRENVTAPWILFEAGALAKKLGYKLEHIFVCPYLLDFEPSELTGPLAQFQAAVANKQDTLDLLRGVNNAMEKPLSEDHLVATFEEWWPKLEADLDNIPAPHQEEMATKAKEFKAYEIVEGKRRNLPLLPRPIHTYTDDEGNFDYGTVFAFALGQNPEVFITFEKYPEGISCELARIGGAEEMHVLWKGWEIWKSDLGGEEPPEFSRSYINFSYADLENGKLYTEPDTEDTNMLPRDIVVGLSEEDTLTLSYIMTALHNWQRGAASGSQDIVEDSMQMLNKELGQHNATVRWNTESHRLSILKGEHPTHERYTDRLQSAEIARGPNGSSIVRIEIEPSITRNDMICIIAKAVREMLFGKGKNTKVQTKHKPNI